MHFVPEYCKTQEKYVKAVDTCAVVFNSVADRFKTQEMCDKAGDDFLPLLKFVSNRVYSK